MEEVNWVLLCGLPIIIIVLLPIAIVLAPISGELMDWFFGSK